MTDKIRLFFNKNNRPQLAWYFIIVLALLSFGATQARAFFILTDGFGVTNYPESNFQGSNYGVLTYGRGYGYGKTYRPSTDQNKSPFNYRTDTFAPDSVNTYGLGYGFRLCKDGGGNDYNYFNKNENRFEIPRANLVYALQQADVVSTETGNSNSIWIKFNWMVKIGANSYSASYMTAYANSLFYADQTSDWSRFNFNINQNGNRDLIAISLANSTGFKVRANGSSSNISLSIAARGVTNNQSLTIQKKDSNDNWANYATCVVTDGFCRFDVSELYNNQYSILYPDTVDDYTARNCGIHYLNGGWYIFYNGQFRAFSSESVYMANGFNASHNLGAVNLRQPFSPMGNDITSVEPALKGICDNHFRNAGTCGDGIKQESEQCDGADFGCSGCPSGTSGAPRCSNTCMIDTSTCQSPNNTCTETDNGQEFLTKGVNTIKNVANQIIDTKTDTCNNSDRLTEYYCIGGSLHVTVSSCQYGCSNGACIKKECLLLNPLNTTDLYIYFGDKYRKFNNESIFIGHGFSFSNVISSSDTLIPLGAPVASVEQAIIDKCINHESTATCTDSDGGVNAYIKGTVDLWASNGNYLGGEDYCTDGSGSKFDKSSHVLEHSCKGSADAGYSMRVDGIVCPNGCADGACINAAPSPKTFGTIKCTDNLSNLGLTGFGASDTLASISSNRTKLEALVNQTIALKKNILTFNPNWDPFGPDGSILPQTRDPLLGQCKFLRHWSNKECYTYSYKLGGKYFGPYTDPLCNNQSEQVKVMVDAIMAGACCGGTEYQPPSLAKCGNAVLDKDEQCDGLKLWNDSTCQSIGYASGTLKCSDKCVFDYSGCVKKTDDIKSHCGNGIVEAGEQCDGVPIFSDCRLKGYKFGKMVCNSKCQLDLSGCYNEDSSVTKPNESKPAETKSTPNEPVNKKNPITDVKPVVNPKFNLTGEAKLIYNSGATPAGLNALLKANGKQKKNVAAQRTNMTKYTNILNRLYGPYKIKWLYNINNFITYGTPSTKHLTSKQRYQLVADDAEYNDDIQMTVDDWVTLLETAMAPDTAEDGQVLGVKIFTQGAQVYKQLLTK